MLELLQTIYPDFQHHQQLNILNFEKIQQYLLLIQLLFGQIQQKKMHRGRLRSVPVPVLHVDDVVKAQPEDQQHVFCSSEVTSI